MTEMDCEQAKFAGQLVWPSVTTERTIVLDMTGAARPTVYAPTWDVKDWITFDMKPAPGYKRFSEMAYDKQYDILAVRLNA